MRVCHYCKQDIRQAVGCDAPIVYQPDGPTYARIPYGQEHKIVGRKLARCPNCHAAIGMLHHPGCTTEECPACRLKLAACHCALMFRHSSTRKPVSAQVESATQGQAVSTPAKQQVRRPSRLPGWRPTRQQREDSLAAIRFGRLAGCWERQNCKLTIADGQVRHECDGVVQLVPLAGDAEVVANLREQHDASAG